MPGSMRMPLLFFVRFVVIMNLAIVMYFLIDYCKDSIQMFPEGNQLYKIFTNNGVNVCITYCDTGCEQLGLPLIV